MRVLDLGCGSERDLGSSGVTAFDEVPGLDIDHRCVAVAKTRFSNRTYLQGAGECLPFKDGTFDRVISALALPYMNIQKTLAEIHRILVLGGGLSVSLHLPSFTKAELLHKAIPRPIPTIFRPYVMSNGLLFHYTERNAGFLKAPAIGMPVWINHLRSDESSGLRIISPCSAQSVQWPCNEKSAIWSSVFDDARADVFVLASD